MELLKKKGRYIRTDIDPITNFRGTLEPLVIPAISARHRLHGETRTGERGGQRTISNIYSLNFTIKKTL